MEDYVRRTECQVLCQKLADEDERQNHRIDKLEKQQEHITKLTISVKELALEVKNLVSEIGTQGTRIQTLENRDGEKWRGTVKTIFTVAITALITSGVSALFQFFF